MNLSLINPYIRVAMQSKISKGHTIMPRVIYDYELIYLEDGEFTFVYDGIKYDCHAGDFIFIRPGIEHSFHVDSCTISQPHIHFDITYRAQSKEIPVSFKNINQMNEKEASWIHKDYFSSFPRSPFITIKNRQEFLDNFYQIVCQNVNDFEKKICLMKLLSMIISDNFSQTIEEQPTFHIVQQIKDYLDMGNGLCMELDDFANTFFYSKFYLEKKFKEFFKVGIIKYRNQKRMEFALNLLENNSVSEVAEKLGYQSIFSFSRAYKQFYGTSPSKRK